MASVLEHTIALCEHLYDDLPPLVPSEIKENMEKAMDQMKNNINLTLEEVENVMIFFGKQLWPYRQAYKEFYNVYEGMLGEKFFVRKLWPQLKTKYIKYTEQGGTYRELHRGKDLSFFSHEERAEFSMALVDVERDIDNYCRQTVSSTDQYRYEQRVQEFQKILNDIESRLGALREMSQIEGEHPELVAEIEQQIKGFEHGLCLLGPRTDYDEVKNAKEHFEGRRHVISMHKSVM